MWTFFKYSNGSVCNLFSKILVGDHSEFVVFYVISSFYLWYSVFSVSFSFKDALLQHVKRSIYQAGIWAISDDHQQNTPSPDMFGWKKEDGCWVPVWLTLPEVSRSWELVKCSCKAQCFRCKCAKAGLPCTDLCKCKCSKWLNSHSTQFPTVELGQLLSYNLCFAPRSNCRTCLFPV